jgi:hypothetical protein
MFLLGFGIFSMSFMSGGAIGILARHRNMTIGDGLVPAFVTPIAGVSSVSALSIIASNPTNLTIGAGIIGFIAGNIVIR